MPKSLCEKPLKSKTVKNLSTALRNVRNDGDVIWKYFLLGKRKNFFVCDVAFPGLNHLGYWYDRQRTPLRGKGRLGNNPVGSRLSELLFLDVSGTAAEQVRTCGLRRNSSSLHKAPKMRDSVRLNSWESFLVNLPSIFLETWVMYSSPIYGLSVFCGWLFLVFSGISPETAANFLLFLNFAIILREKLVGSEDWIDFNFFNKLLISSFMREKVSIIANS